MKKTQRTDSLRNIQKKIISYLSVCIIVMLGIGGFSTAFLENNRIRNGALEYYDEVNFKDFELVSSLGFTQEDLDNIKKQEYVEDAEGTIVVSGQLIDGEKQTKVEIDSMTERISTPYLYEGKKPSVPDECAVSIDLARKLDLSVGDTVIIRITSVFDEDALYNTSFRISGTVAHPDYLRQDSKYAVFLNENAFDKSVTDDRYTRAYLKVTADGEESVFSAEYLEKAQNIYQKLQGLASLLSKEQADTLKREFIEQFEEKKLDAEKQLLNASKQLQDSEDELAKGNQQLQDAISELNAAKKEAQMQLDEARAKIETAENQLIDAKSELCHTSNELAEKSAEYNEAYDRLQEYHATVDDPVEYGDDLIILNTYLVIWADEKDDLDEHQLETVEQVRVYNEAADLFAQAVMEAYMPVARCEMNGEDTTDAQIEADQQIQEAREVFLQTVEGRTLQEIDVDTLLGLYKRMIDENGLGEYYTQEDLLKLRATMLGLQKLSNEELADKIEEYGKAKAIKECLFEADEILFEMGVELSDAEIRLAQGWQAYEEGLEKLADAKWELEWNEADLAQKFQDSEKQIASARDRLIAGDKQLASYRQEYEEKQKEYETQISDAQKQIDEIDSVWLVEDLDANMGYFDLKSNFDSVSKTGMGLGVLFLIVGAMVTASTLIIIIDDQRKQVGTTKAFGFYNREILGKYLVFGISAAVIGSLSGVVLAKLLAKNVLSIMDRSNMYAFQMGEPTISPAYILTVVLVAVIMCTLVTIAACGGLIRTPAALLMKGEILKKVRKKKNSAKKQSQKSLYSRLILRNMINDRARVLVTIAIIAGSCLIVGLGFTMKNAFDGMVSHQVSDIYTYDIRVDLPESLSEENRQKIETYFSGNGIEYASARYESRMYSENGSISALTMITGSDDLGRFIGINDPETGKEIVLPKDGVLAQHRFLEAFEYETGETLKMYDDGLHLVDVPISGAFLNYYGRYFISSFEAYEKVFGTKADVNAYYVNLNSKSITAFEEDLSGINRDIGFDTPDSFVLRTSSISKMYSIIIIIMIVIAIILSFMILLNMTNIYISKKRKEVIIMRINGFSYKDTIVYLIRETILTTILGIVFGIILGYFLAPLLISFCQSADNQFITEFNVKAWAIASGIEIVFAFIVNLIAYRKIRSFNMREITAS
ncbi:MAG: FtsX-like permease family protein [Erysipelotrichaceae bacterium]|nr:FtsX-like permease family protein [Erysipelotrichaceae bacterium]